MKEKALVIDLQRLSTEDGPGIRTTVFFKGCNLRCAWCHNPESLSFQKQIEWYRDRCLGCGLCVAACRQRGLALEGRGMRIDRERCVSCESCVRACPGGAMAVKGAEWEVDSLARELLKDRAYFGRGGGVTVSGGEALMQSDFVAALLARLRAAGVHTAVDTAGLVGWEIFEKVLPDTDLVLLDLKLWDPELHRRFTGAENGLILENAGRLAKRARETGRPALWVRTPVIPGATDAPENIAGIGAFIRENLADVLERWELCAFNNLCRDKYLRLGMDWDFKSAELMAKPRMEELCRIAQENAGGGVLVRWSGSTRLSDA